MRVARALRESGFEGSAGASEVDVGVAAVDVAVVELGTAAARGN